MMMDSTPWLKNFTPDADREAALLLCFPHSGGAASVFRPLAEVIAGRLCVVGVQYPGRQERFQEAVVTDLHDLASQIAAVLRKSLLPQPVIFLGHSMGALVAYEVAQRLHNGVPAALVVSGCPAPSSTPSRSNHKLEDSALIERLIALGGTEAAVLSHPSMRALLLPMIRGDYQASETYRPTDAAPLTCPLIALAGDGDPAVDAADMRAWERHTTGPSHMEILTGDHFFVFGHWAYIADIIAHLPSGR